jgi:hypothetical protein
MKLDQGRFTRFKSVTRHKPKKYAMRFKLISSRGEWLVNQLVDVPTIPFGCGQINIKNGGYLDYWIEKQ